MTMLMALCLTAAFERYYSSPHAQGMGFASFAGAQATDAVRFNSARLAGITGNHVATGYDRLFGGIDGLHNVNAAFARPLGPGGIGLHLSEFGIAAQSEVCLTAGYGLALSSQFSAGAGLNCYLVNNERTGTGYALGLDIGLVGRLPSKWTLAAVAHDVNRPRFGDGEEGTMDPSLTLAVAYRPLEDINSEIDMSLIRDEFSFRCGGEFRIFNRIWLRSGMRTNPTVFDAGIGITIKQLTIDYAADLVINLPITHSLGLGYSF